MGNDHFCDTKKKVSQRLTPNQAPNIKGEIPLYHRSGWINPLIPQPWKQPTGCAAALLQLLLPLPQRPKPPRPQSVLLTTGPLEARAASAPKGETMEKGLGICHGKPGVFFLRVFGVGGTLSGGLTGVSMGRVSMGLVAFLGFDPLGLVGMHTPQRHMAMSQNPNRLAPSEHPTSPLKSVLKWVVHSPTPKWDPIGFDPHPYRLVFRGNLQKKRASLGCPFKTTPQHLVSSTRDTPMLQGDKGSLHTRKSCIVRQFARVLLLDAIGLLVILRESTVPLVSPS